MIQEEKLKLIKERLEKERELLIPKIAQNETVTEFGSDVEGKDMTEEIEEVEDFSNKLAVAQVFKERLEEVENALNKLKLGKYGVCEKCGKEVEVDILVESPARRHCSVCAGLV